MTGWDIDGTGFYQRLNAVNRLMLSFDKEFDAARARYDKGMADGLDKKLK